MFSANKKDTRTTPMTYFTPCSSVSIVNFEQVNADWVSTCFEMSYHFKVFVSLFLLLPLSLNQVSYCGSDWSRRI